MLTQSFFRYSHPFKEYAIERMYYDSQGKIYYRINTNTLLSAINYNYEKKICHQHPSGAWHITSAMLTGEDIKLLNNFLAEQQARPISR